MKNFLRTLAGALAALPFFLSGSASAKPAQDTNQEATHAWNQAKSVGTYTAFAKFAIDYADDPRAIDARKQLEKAVRSRETVDEQQVAIMQPGDLKESVPAFNPNSLVVI